MCGIIMLVINMIIDSVIQKEFQRNEKMILQYENVLNSLPRGSIICRKNEYFYLKYREGSKVHDKYIGKNGKAVDEMREKLSYRKHCEKMLATLKDEQKLIIKMMEVTA